MSCGSNPNKQHNNTETSYGSAFSTTDVGMCAVDLDNAKIWWGKNGTWFASGNPATGANAAFTDVAGTVFPAVFGPDGSVNCTCVLNAGARPFAYTAPSGFKALCTANLPAPLVTKPNTVMDVVLYTGTGSSLTLPYASSTPTSIAFTPDLVWIKGRSGATDHALYDAVRDVQKDLVSNSTAAETTQSTGLTAFGTNTFTIGSLAKLNTSSATYAAWCWDAGSSTVTNTQGSITSSVRANATAGFSVVTYTGAGNTASTVGHGLGVAAQLIIIKNRTDADDWAVYHQSITNDYYLNLNSTAARSNSVNMWNDTSPTSTVFSLGAAGGSDAVNRVNKSGQNYVAYCFAPVVGYSNAFSITGNGSTDGPMCYLGFRPRLIIYKRTDTSGDNWFLHDTARDTYNVLTGRLFPNTSGAESTNINVMDVLSNGFKLRTNDTSWNASGGTYVGFAWAESPFQYARAR